MRTLLTAFALLAALGCAVREEGPMQPPARTSGSILGPSVSSTPPAMPAGETPLPPGRPVAAEPAPLALVGPTPTRDPATWVYLPEGVLLQALMEVDDAPATTLDPAQAERTLRLLQTLEKPILDDRTAGGNLLAVASGVLTPAQAGWLKEARRSLHGRAFDLDSLVRTLPREPGPSGPVGSTTLVGWSAEEVAAGLLALQESGTPLPEDQAAALRPAVERYQRTKAGLAESLAPAPELMNPAQLQAFVALLVRSRQADTFSGAELPDFETVVERMSSKLPGQSG